MTPKQEDQLLVDYFNSDDTIKVNCRWLQERLRQSNNGSQKLQQELKNALYHIDRLSAKVDMLQGAMPTYSLNARI